VSHPVRVRGLKAGILAAKQIALRVAPCAGAWIESPLRPAPSLGNWCVAPCAGVWIETLYLTRCLPLMFSSHPVRVRGLQPRDLL
jgi:hypothetical protein